MERTAVERFQIRYKARWSWRNGGSRSPLQASQILDITFIADLEAVDPGTRSKLDTQIDDPSSFRPTVSAVSI